MHIAGFALRFLRKWWHTRSGARASFPGVKALPADPLPASRDLWPRLSPIGAGSATLTRLEQFPYVSPHSGVDDLSHNCLVRLRLKTGIREPT